MAEAKTLIEKLAAMEQPPVVWRFFRAAAEGILVVHPVRNPLTGRDWTLRELAGESWEEWMRRTGRKKGAA